MFRQLGFCTAQRLRSSSALFVCLNAMFTIDVVLLLPRSCINKGKLCTHPSPYGEKPTVLRNSTSSSTNYSLART
jgi:hypothetical protein